MKVWQITFPTNEMLVNGDVSQREAEDIFTETLAKHVKENIKLVEFEETGRAALSQQVEESG